MTNDIKIKTVASNIKRYTIFFYLILTIIILIVSDLNVIAKDDIEWEVRLDFFGADGEEDYVIIGESPNAKDGLSKDEFDMPKPPSMPAESYLRSWLDDNLTAPYDVLLADYREFPDISKVWNLSLIWIANKNSSNIVNFSWNIVNISNFEYDSLKLYYFGNNSPIVDLLIEDNFSILLDSNEPQHFQIICETNINNEQNNIINSTTLLTLLAIFIIIIILGLIIWIIKR
jgi:hypothetical protein